jgi:hypothetical protein
LASLSMTDDALGPHGLGTTTGFTSSSHPATHLKARHDLRRAARPSRQLDQAACRQTAKGSRIAST